MTRAKVFITRSLPPVDLEKLHQIAEVETWGGQTATTLLGLAR